MNRAEMQEFWDLMAGLRPLNKEYLQSREVQRAWALAMKPYPLQAAQEALLACCREVSYWPLVSEVISRIPEDQRPTPPPSSGETARAKRMREDLERLKAPTDDWIYRLGIDTLEKAAKKT